MTGAERAYLTNLLTVGRCSVHALDRTIRFTGSPLLADVLEAERAELQADVDRLTAVLGA